MSYPHNILCPTNPSSPEPVGFCDRCGFLVYLSDLDWQLEWAGADITNTFMLVHGTCLDVPNEQRRTIVIGPDPAPLRNIRPGYQVSQEAASGVPPVPPYVIDGDQ